MDSDGVATPFEPVVCDYFVTESTFGLPVFQWQDPLLIFEEIKQWWQQNASEGRPSIIAAYSLGKAQRILKNLAPDIGPLISHPSVEKINAVTREAGVELPMTYDLSDVSSEDLEKSLIICPLRSLDSKWAEPIKNPLIGVASGWMALRSTRKRRNFSRGFVLSDHADWNGLNKAIKLTKAEHIYVTHGYTQVYTKYLNEQGYKAAIVKTKFEGESLDTQQADTSQVTV